MLKKIKIKCVQKSCLYSGTRKGGIIGQEKKDKKSC